MRWSPAGDAVATASDDSTIRLFDLRTDSEVGCYQRNTVLFACNSLDFSVRIKNHNFYPNLNFKISGRLILGGYNDYLVHLWDSMQG